MILQTVRKTRIEPRTLTGSDCGAPVATTERIRDSGTFEPWLAGDRQTPGGVAKPRDPNANGSFEVSLS